MNDDDARNICDQLKAVINCALDGYELTEKQAFALARMESAIADLRNGLRS